MKTKQTIEKIERLLDIIKSNCNESVYMDAYLMSSDGHYDEKSGAYAISLLSYKNGSPSDAGVELNSLYDIAKAKTKALSLSKKCITMQADSEGFLYPLGYSKWRLGDCGHNCSRGYGLQLW